MNALLLMLRLALFLLSCFGWCHWAADRFELKRELAPVAVLSSICVAMSAAGLLNIFTPVEVVLFLGGFAAGAVCLYKNGGGIKGWFQPRYLVLLLLIVWALYLTRGGLISGHDNFAHWAIAAKRIIVENRLPNTADTAVEFTGYPPAAACFIKYFCAVVGFSDGMLLFAQSLLILSGLFALTAFIDARHPGHWVLWVLFCALTLSGQVPLCDLRVDTLLATQGIGAACVVLYEGKKSPQKALLFSLPIWVCLALIKNSGLFFVAAGLVLLLALTLETHVKAAAIIKGAAAGLGAPLAAYWLWLRHVAMVFPAKDTAKHAVSAAAYAAVAGGKTPEDLAEFNRIFFRYFLNPANDDILMLYIAVMLALVVLALSQMTIRKKVLVLAGLGLEEALYAFSLWCTYKFSMNTAEMLLLASFGRYHATNLYFLLAMLFVLSTGEENTTKDKRAVLSLFVLLLGFAAAFCGQAMGRGRVTALFSRELFRDQEDQGRFLEMKNEYGLTDGSRYLIYTRGGEPNGEEADTWSLRYVARYVFNSDAVDFWQYEGQEYTLQELYDNYDYLLVYGPDDYILNWLEINGMDKAAACHHLILQ